MEAWVGEKYFMPTLEECGRDDSEIIRAGEQTLPLTSCSTQESSLYPLLGEHSRSDPVGRDVDELAPKL